jgi:hypothetical protein
MIQCSFQHWQHAIKFTNVPRGNYQVYIYVWQDWNAHNTQPITFFLQGQSVQSGFVMSKKAGEWKKLGPWAAEVAANGTLTLTTRGDVLNISGVEVRVAAAPVVAAAAPEASAEKVEAATPAPVITVAPVVTVAPTEASEGAAWQPKSPAGRALYRGVLFDGPARTIDGNTWEDNTAPNFVVFTVDNCKAAPGAGCAAASFNMTNVLAGKYEVYVHVAEEFDGKSHEFIMGTRRLTVRAKEGMVGPFPVTVNKAGKIEISLRAGSPSLLAFSVWQKR